MQHYYAFETRSLSSCKMTTVEIYKYGEYMLWGEEERAADQNFQCLCNLIQWQHKVGPRSRSARLSHQSMAHYDCSVCQKYNRMSVSPQHCSQKGPRGMFWTKVAQFGPPGTHRKSAFFQERDRKRMKELGEVTFMKEGMKALDDTRILALTHLKNLVSFPRYDRLKKKKCW